MDLVSIALAVVIVWVSVVVVTIALCRVAGRSDRAPERFTATLR